MFWRLPASPPSDRPTRRGFLFLGSLVTVLAMTAGAWRESRAADKQRCWIGTYTGESGSKGIYTVEFDAKTGKFGPLQLAAEVKNPSFLSLHPTNPKFLYAVSEIEDLEGKPTGGVSAFSIDAATGKLTLLNQQSSEGGGPCHLNLDKTGSALVVANYGGGSVASFPVAADGKLGKAASAIQHKGTSVNPQRQTAPHAHSIYVDPSNRFVVSADLGLDQLLIYKLDVKSAKLAPHDPPYASVAGGAGPRHFAFHPSGKFGWVINELGNTVTGFAFDSAQGTLKEIESVTTLPEGYSEASYTAEVVVHPNGKFLYGSNRGHDSIAMFSINAETGKLTSLGQEPTQGKFPRNFNLDATGQYIFAENQNSNNIVVFRIDPSTGKLKPTGEKLEVGAPVCLKCRVQ